MCAYNMCMHTHINNHTNIHTHLVKYLPAVSFDIFLIKTICFSLCLYRCLSVWLCRAPSYYIVEHNPMSWWSPEQVNPPCSVQFYWIPCLMQLATATARHMSENWTRGFEPDLMLGRSVEGAVNEDNVFPLICVSEEGRGACCTQEQLQLTSEGKFGFCLLELQ